MRFIRPIIAAFSCFSTIPMPYLEWNEDSMRSMMAAFPLIGGVIGVCILIWDSLCSAWDVGVLLRATGYTLIPLLISGGIHMDGFADVMDAHASHADQNRRREILKDPHVGAFAILGVACYLLAYLGFVSEVEHQHLLALACVPLISRCLSGLATVTLRAARTDGMYAAEHDASDTHGVTVALAAMLVCVAVPLFFIDSVATLPMLVAAGGTLVAVKRYAEGAYGGMSGDLAGFFLQVVELVMVICIVLMGKLV